jgi:glycosyltransferase involved in cell wall biosynthesis
VTGYLVEPFDYETLADRIAKLLENDELRMEMGQNGRKRVDPDFRAEKMVADISEVYQELLRRYAPRVAAFDAKRGRV